MNNVFEKILLSKVSRFVDEFTHDSKDIFVDAKGKIYHNGEFGMYREKIVKELLTNILPKRLSIGSGFIITKEGKISTQCDIVIYDSNNCPLIENEEKQIFFPIECVVAIGEIKSDIKSKSTLRNILLKIQNNKLLRNDIDSSAISIYRNQGVISCINPTICPEDSIVSFLICNKISSINKKKILSNIYDKDSSYSKHNLILSIQDGTFLYIYNNEIHYAPIFDGNPCKDIFVPKDNDNNSHIIVFLNYLYLAITNNSIFKMDISNYLIDKTIKYYDCIKNNKND